MKIEYIEKYIVLHVNLNFVQAGQDIDELFEAAFIASIHFCLLSMHAVHSAKELP